MPEKPLVKHLRTGALIVGGLLILSYVSSRTTPSLKPYIPEVAISSGRYYVGPVLGKKDYRAHANTSISNLYIMQTEVTCKLYVQVRDLSTARYGYQLPPLECDGRSESDSALLPVAGVSWWDACVFANALSTVSGRKAVYRDSNGAVIKDSKQVQADLTVERDATADGYRLPTAAEWQIAARGGSVALDQDSYGFAFSGSDIPDDVAWIGGTADAGLHAVALKKPNQLGLHDMSGNVAEWTDSALSLGQVKEGTYRMYWYCGGSVTSDSESRLNVCDTHSPQFREADLGFRLVRQAVKQGTAR